MHARNLRRGDLLLGIAGLLLLVVPLPAGSPNANSPALLISLMVLLAIEEAGVPLPLPGDLGVLYIGYLMGRGLAQVWVVVPGLLLAVLTGATILYGLGRWWGGGLVGPLLQRVPADKMEKARRLIERYGVLAVAVARAVPGLRIACSLVAGSVKIPYPLFVGGVGLCSSLWIAVLLIAGSHLGSWGGGRLSPAALAPAVHGCGLVLLLAAGAITAVRLTRQPRGAL
ncbi:MAG: DedA family protein [Chloroflexota bacterium]